MTHAICLACGGNPSSVGRSTDLTQFVRRGSQGGEAYAEVDILKTNRMVMSVRRVINTETKGSKWFMDERSSTQRDVKAAMKAMNIDVDNLCSFMAQDKVGSFSQANAKEILHMTLESIVNSTGKKLSEEQKELASVESTKLARQREMDARQSQVESLQNDLDGMRAEVERMEQRGSKKKLLEQYKM
jgi:chromosome segregation ATPase